MREWLEVFENDDNMPKELRSVKFDVKEYCKKLPEAELDKEIDCDLNDTLALSLHELKNLIQYDLRIDKEESDANF